MAQEMKVVRLCFSSVGGIALLARQYISYSHSNASDSATHAVKKRECPLASSFSRHGPACLT